MFTTVFWHLGPLMLIYASRLFYFGTLFNTLAKLRTSFGQCEASLDKLWHSSLPRGHFVTLPAHLFSWFLLKANFLCKPVNVRVRCPVHRVRTFLRCQSSQFHSQCCSRGKLDSLNASSLSNIITHSLLICICGKKNNMGWSTYRKGYQWKNLILKFLSKSPNDNHRPHHLPWFLLNFGPKLEFLREL